MLLRTPFDRNSGRRDDGVVRVGGGHLYIAQAASHGLAYYGQGSIGESSAAGQRDDTAVANISVPFKVGGPLLPALPVRSSPRPSGTGH